MGKRGVKLARLNNSLGMHIIRHAKSDERRLGPLTTWYYVMGCV